MVSQDSTCLVSQDSTSLVSQDSTCLVSPDSTCLVSQDSTCLVSQDSTCLVSQDSTCLVSQDSTCQGCQEHQKLVVSGTNVVAMARHGPILQDNEATGSGKVFKYLPGLRDIIFISKMAATRKRSKPFAVFQQAGEPSRLATFWNQAGSPTME